MAVKSFKVQAPGQTFKCQTRLKNWSETNFFVLNIGDRERKFNAIGTGTGILDSAIDRNHRWTELVSMFIEHFSFVC